MGILGSVAAPHGRDQPDDFPTRLEAGANQACRHPKRQQGIGRHHHMGTRHQHAQQLAPPLLEELLHHLEIGRRQRREARQRRAPTAIEGRRQAPNSTATLPELALLHGRVLHQPIRRIGHHGMNALRRLRRKPLKAIRSEEPSLADREGWKRWFGSFSGDVQWTLQGGGSSSVRTIRSRTCIYEGRDAHRTGLADSVIDLHDPRWQEGLANRIFTARRSRRPRCAMLLRECRTKCLCVGKQVH